MEGSKILVFIVFMSILYNVSSDNGASARRDILEFIFSYQDRSPGGGYNGHQDQNGAHNANQGLYFASPYGYLSPNSAHHGYPIQNKAFPSDYQSLDSASSPYRYQNLDSASSETTSHVVNIVNLDDLQNIHGTNALKDAILGYVLGEMTGEVKSFVESNLCPKCFVEDDNNNNNTKSSQELGKMEELMTSLLEENSRFILEQTQALLSLNLAEHYETMENVIGKKVKKVVTKALDDILLKLETETRDHEEEEEKEEDELYSISTTESLEPITNTESLTTTADPVIETTTVEMTTGTFTTETSAGDLIISPTETLPVFAKGIISAEDEENDGVEFSRIPQQMPDGYKKPIMVTMNGPISMGGHPHGINIYNRKPKPGPRPRPPKRKPVKPKQFNNKNAINV